jgi:hypothetical protein
MYLTALGAPVLAASTSAFDQPGTLGFLVVFGMGVILYFVFRSMARHLRKVNTAAREAEAAEMTAGAQASGIQASGTGGAPDGGVPAGRPGDGPAAL